MAKRKRKTSGRSTASRRKNRTQDRMPAGLITLFAGLVLMALAFVPGSSAWRTMHDVLFGVFGCGSFVLGAALFLAAASPIARALGRRCARHASAVGRALARNRAVRALLK